MRNEVMHSKTNFIHEVVFFVRLEVNNDESFNFSLKLSLMQASRNEQLKNVLEENVSLQKQLIKVEKKLLSSHLKKTPHTESRG